MEFAILVTNIMILIAVIFVFVGYVVFEKIAEKERKEEHDKFVEMRARNSVNEKILEMREKRCEELKSITDQHLHRLFGNFSQINITDDPITKQVNVICEYPNKDVVKWEIKGNKMNEKGE